MAETTSTKSAHDAGTSDVIGTSRSDQGGTTFNELLHDHATARHAMGDRRSRRLVGTAKRERQKAGRQSRGSNPRSQPRSPTQRAICAITGSRGCDRRDVGDHSVRGGGDDTVTTGPRCRPSRPYPPHHDLQLRPSDCPPAPPPPREKRASPTLSSNARRRQTYTSSSRPTRARTVQFDHRKARGTVTLLSLAQQVLRRHYLHRIIPSFACRCDPTAPRAGRDTRSMTSSMTVVQARSLALANSGPTQRQQSYHLGQQESTSAITRCRSVPRYRHHARHSTHGSAAALRRSVVIQSGDHDHMMLRGDVRVIAKQRNLPRRPTDHRLW